MPKLIIKNAVGSRELVLTKDVCGIGRTPDNDIEVKDSLISRRHSSIKKEAGIWSVYDLQSSNGTYVNRERIEKKLLDNGDVIRVGDTEITFVDENAPPARLKSTVAANPPTKHDEKNASQHDGQMMHVEDIADSYNFDISGALASGASLRDIKKEVGGEKAAKESTMFYILFQVSKQLTVAKTLDDMLESSMKMIFDVISADRGVMFLGKVANQLEARLAWSRKSGKMAPGEIKVSSTITNQVVSKKVVVTTSNAQQDFSEGLSIVQYNIRSALCAPLWDNSGVCGAIYLDNVAKNYAFTKDDQELLSGIANIIASRIGLEELNRKLRQEEMLRANLSKYHSPDVVEMLVKGGKDIGLEVVERDVSVIFVDVESSTKMAEAIGPKATVAILNRFFEMVTSSIFRNKGSVNKFIGDEVMAIYNAPLDLPDHPVHAVRTAVEIVQQVVKYNQENPDQQFNIHVGINTGPVVAGNIGSTTRMEYTVIGDTVNVCARLTKQLPVNRITIGERTHAAVKDHFKVKDLGDTMIRGRDRSMRAYEVIP